MQITHEEPGRRLELAEAESRFNLPVLALGLGLTVLVALPWGWLWDVARHGAAHGPLDLVPSGIMAAAGLFILLSAFGGQRLEGLSCDRDANRLEWRRSHVLGLVRWSGGWALDSLDGFKLALASPPGRAPSRGALPLRLTLRRSRASGGGERSIELRVADLDQTGEIADFGLRLGAAAGLSFYLVTVNEGGRFAIELRAQAAPGLLPVPVPKGRSRYEENVVSREAAAVAAAERLPGFEPTAFRGSARVSVWAPGSEVRFDRGWGLGVLLSPLLLAALLGPLAFFRLSSLHTMPLLPRVAALGLITMAGLGLALVGWFGLDAGLPRHVRLDWATGRLRVDTLRRTRAILLGDVASLELRHKAYTTGRVSGGMVRTSYWSQVLVRLRAPADPPEELLVQTRSFRNDAAAPRAMALPLARELAAALQVELRETGPS